MSEEKITDPRAAFMEGYDQARFYYGTTTDGDQIHGAECDKTRNPDHRCTCDDAVEERRAAQRADLLVGADTQEVAALRAELAAMEQRAVVAELGAANERAGAKTIHDALAELRKAQRGATQRRSQNELALEADVEALTDAARELATAYGRAKRFEEVAYEEHDEDDPPGLWLLDARALIPALAGLLSELAAADHPSIAYPTPGQRTVRVAEAAARGVLGNPAGTITQAVYATLEAAVELHRVRELRGEGEPEPASQSDHEIRAGDPVWVRSFAPLVGVERSWWPARVDRIGPGDGPIVVTPPIDLTDSERRFSGSITIPQPVTSDQLRPRGGTHDRAVIVPPVEEHAGVAPA